MRLRLIILLPLFLTVACSANSLPSIKSGTTIQANFPYDWIEQLNFAYKDFEKFGYNNSCYIVGFGNKNNYYYISFSPKKELVRKGDIIIFNTGVSSDCGNGVTYLFDNEGKYIKRHFIR